MEVFLLLIILGIPVYFTWHRIFKKRFNTIKKRRIFTWLTTIVFTPILYIGLIEFFIFSICYYPRQHFNKQKWITEKNERYKYSEDLISSKLLIGKTKRQVLQLLGTDEANNKQNNKWVYMLGFVPGLASIDPDILEIEFKEGKVIYVLQRQT